jgi:hypothetical protein
MIDIINLSNTPKFGLKGKGAIDFLVANGIEIPENPNCAILGENIVLRLGVSEFLIEGDIAIKLATQIRPDNAYPILRQDYSLQLKGNGIGEFLLQTCAIDFSQAKPNEVFLTSMIGVGVIILIEESTIRIWCDPSFSDYIAYNFNEIAQAINFNNQKGNAA